MLCLRLIHSNGLKSADYVRRDWKVLTLVLSLLDRA